MVFIIFSYEPPCGFISVADSTNATSKPLETTEVSKVNEETGIIGRSEKDQETSSRLNFDSRSRMTKISASGGRRTLSSREYQNYKAELDFSPKDLIDSYGTNILWLISLVK